MKPYKKLWVLLFFVTLITFCILGFVGRDVYRQAPPIPDQYISQKGDLVFSKDKIFQGQSAWQGIGGMQLGSIFGHGAYQAPDWTADWLHRELMNWLNISAQEKYQKPFLDLEQDQQVILKQLLKNEYRNNQVNNHNQVILSETRTQAIKLTSQYYLNLFGDDKSLQKTRQSFAMKEDTLPNLQERENLNSFFFWTAWTASTNRPESLASYTNNWPHEPLIDNVPTAENIIWSIASIVFLLIGIATLVWGWGFFREKDDVKKKYPIDNPLQRFSLSASQKALRKYVLLVFLLFTGQVFIGGFVAHYTVEGQTFYGIDVSQWFPYSLMRTWHIQLALFWIATSFLALGLFLTPIINGGKDPKYQKIGVDILFYALILVVVGSFTGQFLAISQIIPLKYNFWFGHQGYEYIDIGRFWQILKWGGILFWLVLVLRGTLGAFKNKGDKNLLAIFLASVLAVGLFYGAGLMYGEHTNIAIMEYWRWWVVHLWVEGFFEIFATVAIAYIFYQLGLVSSHSAIFASLVSSSLFLLGGVPGTFHHLYFTGTTTSVMAIGASFSALEVVPLILIGYEAWGNWDLRNKTVWMEYFKWPLYCFIAVSFWNALGAGVFGFMINPPISLYYVQGLNTTAVHAHAALFGVYGFLAIGFVLFIACCLNPNKKFNDKNMKIGFWSLNFGIFLMITMSLFPIGIIQAYASITEGLWYARSEIFMQQSLLQDLRWIRGIGDVVFIVGVLFIFYEILRILFKNRAKDI